MKIGDYNHNGTLQLTDTNWDSNGTLRVTVRELVGEKIDSSTKHGKLAIKRARTYARKALPEHYKGQTRKSPLVRKWFADGCTHFTFNVSRVE